VNDILKALLDNDTKDISNQERLRLISSESSLCAFVTISLIWPSSRSSRIDSDLDNWGDLICDIYL